MLFYHLVLNLLEKKCAFDPLGLAFCKIQTIVKKKIRKNRYNKKYLGKVVLHHQCNLHFFRPNP